MLSGCEKEENNSVHIFSTDSSAAVSSEQSSSSSAAGSSVQSSSAVSSSAQSSSAASSSTVSSPEQSSEPVSTPQQSASSTKIEPSVSEPDVPVFETKTIVYNHDPKNACSITFDGSSITVKGKYGDLFDGAAEIYPPMNITRSVEGGELTCVLTPTSTRFDRRYGSFAILDKGGYRNVVHIDLANGGVMFPDVSGLVRSSKMAVSSVINTTEARTAQYITLDGKRDKIPQILDEIKKISDDICKGIDSDYEKLRAISRWVSDNIYYDHPAFSNGAPQSCLSLEYMLNNRSSVCGGYSNMTSALCAAQGIRCLNISGMAVNNGKCYLQDAIGGFHEWNIAEIDGRQIIVDSGWNSGNDFNYDGTFSSDPPCYKYFDISEEVFSLDHKAQKAEYRDYWALAQ